MLGSAARKLEVVDDDPVAGQSATHILVLTQHLQRQVRCLAGQNAPDEAQVRTKTFYEQVFLVCLLPSIIEKVFPTREQVAGQRPQTPIPHLGNLHILHQDVLLIFSENAWGAAEHRAGLRRGQHVKRHVGRSAYAHQPAWHVPASIARRKSGICALEGRIARADEQDALARGYPSTRMLDKRTRSPGVHLAEKATNIHRGETAIHIVATIVHLVSSFPHMRGRRPRRKMQGLCLGERARVA